MEMPDDLAPPATRPGRFRPFVCRRLLARVCFTQPARGEEPKSIAWQDSYAKALEDAGQPTGFSGSSLPAPAGAFRAPEDPQGRWAGGGHGGGNAPDIPANPVALAALRDQLDTYWQRALAGYADAAEAPAEEA